MNKVGNFLDCTSYVSTDANIQIFGPQVWYLAMIAIGINASVTTGSDSTATTKLLVDDAVIITAEIYNDKYAWFPRKRLMDTLEAVVQEHYKHKVSTNTTNISSFNQSTNYFNENTELSDNDSHHQSYVITRNKPKVKWNKNGIPTKVIEKVNNNDK